MKSCFYTCIPLLLFCGTQIIVPAQTKLINPDISNSFIDDYVLPDGTIRFIGSEHGINRELFFVDRFPDGTISEQVFFPEAIGELEFNFAGVECKVLPLDSGDVLLGIDQGDCDYAPYSSLARFNKFGEVIWAVSMGDYYFSHFITKLTLVDINIICMISDQSDTLYFTTSGISMEKDHQYIVYDTIVVTNFGYYTTLNNYVFSLDENFDKIDSIQLDDRIVSLSISGDSLVMVATPVSVNLLNTELEVVAHSPVYQNIDLVAASTNWIWVGRQSGDLIQLDYQLNGHDTFYIHKDIQLKSLNTINKDIILGGNYIGVGSSVFFHIAKEDVFKFQILKDISIESISVDEPVFYDFEPNAWPFGFNIPYKNLSIHVSNTGYDTIQYLTILHLEGQPCLPCQNQNREWVYDSLNLYPESQREFILEDFSAWCVPTPSSFCLYILPADDLPETNRSNNRLCIDVQSFYTDVNETESILWKVIPNPADQYIAIESTTALAANDYHVEIFNIYGQRMIDEPIISSNQMFNTSLLVSGIYSVMLSNASGEISVFKLVINHTR